MTPESDRTNVRYEPDEKPPMLLTVGLGVQFTVLVVAGIILTPAIVIRVAGGDEVFLVWAAFAALLVSGLTTILQARRLGPIGAGYILIMGTSGAFIAVSVTALSEGGPAMLATLVFVSSLVQFSLARRLSLLRRIFTPAVTGTVIMLIPVTVMPIIFDTLVTVPQGTPPFVAPLCAAITLGVIVAVAFVGSPTLRLWALIIGIVAGCAVSAMFGLYDTSRIGAADWVGIPLAGWPGYDLSFGPSFWSLLAAFIFVTYIGAIETVGDSVAIQSVSWRRARAIDYREVQGAVTADGVGNLLSGLAGTVPNTTYSTSIAVTELTGVAARRVGVAVGVVLVAVAIVPKFAAVVLAIPGPVAAAYLTVLLSLLFTAGMRLVVREGLDYRKGIIVGVSFWVGSGFQHGVIFPELLGPWWSGLFGNGMTAGGLTAIFLTVILNLATQRSQRMTTLLHADALPDISGFLERIGSRFGWNQDETTRLLHAGEESVLTLIEANEDGDGESRRLVVKARREGNAIELEFVTAGSGSNLEDEIMLLSERPNRTSVEQELSLRLLRHFASSVRHQRFTNADILTARIEQKLETTP